MKFYPTFLLSFLSQSYISISTRHPSIFSREEWRTIPYQHTPATILDKLKDILLQIPILLKRLDVLTSTPLESWHKAEKANIENDTRGVMIQLDGLEDILKAVSYPTNLSTVLINDAISPSAPQIQDSTTPMAIAYQRTAKTLCLYILSCFHINSQEELRVYCTDTLDSAQGLFDGEVLHSSYWRQVLLLKIVAFAVPGDCEKKIAWEILEGWAGKTGLCGIKMRGHSSAWDINVASILSQIMAL